MPDVRPFVIAVGGIPGAGKTTLARGLAAALYVPLLVRDEIKEGMHVTAGSDDPSEVHRFASAAFDVFWSTARDFADAGVSLVIEAAFHREYSGAEFAKLHHRADLRLVWCHADPQVALSRYRARAPLRHPAHADDVSAERMSHPAFDRSIYDPPPGPWPLIEVDTSGSDPVPSIADLRRSLSERPTGARRTR